MCSYLPAPQLLKQKFHIFPCNEISIDWMIPKLADLLTKSLVSKQKTKPKTSDKHRTVETSEAEKEERT